MEHLLIFHLARMINPFTYARLFPVFASKVGEKGAPVQRWAPLDTLSEGGVVWVARFSPALTYMHIHTHTKYTHTFKIDEVRAELRVGVDEERQSFRARLARRAHFAPPSPSSRVRW